MTDSSDRPVIALFGGSFAPPHRAHQYIPVFLLEHGYADQVWYVPVKHHPFGKVISSDQDRQQMLEITINNTLQDYPQLKDKLKIETWELNQQATNYTLTTLRALSAEHPQFTFRCIIGTDNLPQFRRWHHYEQILEEFGVFVYPRVNYPPEPLFTGMQFLADAPEVDVSSTQVRQKVAAGQPITNLVLPEIEDYIMSHNLYLS